MKVRAITLLLALLWLPVITSAQAYLTNEFHDLNDNQVPNNWRLVQGGGSGGLQNGRLNAYHTDASWELIRTGTIDPAQIGGNTMLQIDWDGNVAYSNPGMSTGIRLQIGSCEMRAWVGIDIWRPAQQPGVRIIDCAHPATSPLYTQAYPYDYTSYHSTVTLSEGQIRFRSVKIADGSVVCDATSSDPAIVLSQLQELAIGVYTTVTADAWADNIGIQIIGGGQPPQNELVAFWPMDETSGSTVADASGNGLNGIANGTTIIDGVSGKARSLNGVSDYIEVPNNSVLNINDAITIMMWAKLDQSLSAGLLICKRLYSASVCEINYDIYAGYSGSQHWLAFQYGTGCSTGNNYVLSDLSGLYDGNWHHFAISLRFGDPSSAKWVIDGVLRPGAWSKWNGSSGGGTDIPPTSTYPLEIGRQLSSSPGYAKCSLDQVRLYHGAFGEAEVQGVYNEEKGQFPATVVLSGEVRNQGTLMSGVAVTAIADGSGQTYTAVTGADGKYTVSVPRGGYKIEAAKVGFEFSPQMRTDIFQDTIVNFTVSWPVPGKIRIYTSNYATGAPLAGLTVTAEVVGPSGISVPLFSENSAGDLNVFHTFDLTSCDKCASEFPQLVFLSATCDGFAPSRKVAIPRSNSGPMVLQMPIVPLSAGIQYTNPYWTENFWIEYNATPGSADCVPEPDCVVGVTEQGGTVKKVPVFISELGKALEYARSQYVGLGFPHALVSNYHVNVGDIGDSYGRLSYAYWPTAHWFIQVNSKKWGTNPANMYLGARFTAAHELFHEILQFLTLLR